MNVYKDTGIRILVDPKAKCVDCGKPAYDGTSSHVVVVGMHPDALYWHDTCNTPSRQLAAALAARMDRELSPKPQNERTPENPHA